MTVFFDPKSSENTPPLVFTRFPLHVPTGHGIFWIRQRFIFSPNRCFWGSVSSSRIDEPREKSGSPPSLHASRLPWDIIISMGIDHGTSRRLSLHASRLLWDIIISMGIHHRTSRRLPWVFSAGFDSPWDFYGSAGLP